MKEMEREDRYRIELMRLVSLLADFQDKSTNFMVLGIIGSIMVVIPLVLIFVTFYSAMNFYSSLLASVFLVYFGFFVLYYAFLRKRKFKRSFDKYLEMVSSESLLSSSDYQRLLNSIRNELVHSLEKEGEDKKYPSEEEIKNRRVELDSLTQEVKNLEKRKMELYQVIMTYNKDIAELEQKSGIVRRKAVRRNLDGSSQPDDYPR